MVERRLLRPLELNTFFDETFYLFRHNFWLFMGIAALLYIPLMMIVCYLYGAEGMNYAQYIATLFQPIIIAAGTLAVSKKYLGEDCTVWEAYAAIFKRFFSFVLTMIMASVLIFAGMIAFVIPGIILFYWYAFVCQVFVLEGLSSKDALRRSRNIAEGQWWRVFLINLVFGMILNFITSVLVLPVMIPASIPGQIAARAPIWLVLGLYIGAITAVVMVVQLIISVLLYYDLRVRKEGFDLELLSQELGQQSTPKLSEQAL